MPDDTRQLIAGRYVLTHSLGTGGMGQVWAAEDAVLGRTVAVKAVRLATSGDEATEAGLRARVMREARVAARIDHPGSVRIFDVVDESHTVYLVMELVQAPNLAEVVAEQGPLAPVEAARLGLDVLGALAEAHREGIVHRDVKPNNVMVLPTGRAKLADFGIASIKDDPGLTSTGMVLGTPKYMAPEQARGETAGPAADLWGLGALLYFAVEGVAPFDRGEALPTLNAVLHDPPRPMARAGMLGDVIERLLRKSPEDRPDDEEVRSLLEGVGDRSSTTTEVAAPAERTIVVPAAPASAPPPRPAPQRPGSTTDRRWLAALGVVAAVALVAAVMIARASHHGDRGASTVAGTATTAPAAAPKPTPTTASGTSSTARRPAADRPAGVPADWVLYAGDGWRLWHPGDWQVRKGRGSAVDFVSPSGDYLRLDSVAQSSGDPVAAWESQERSFQAGHPTYQRIRIERTAYRDYDAAIWEYTFEGRHAADLGFAVGSRGFALNLVTAADAWQARSADFRAFQAGFQSP